jgi:hypothetical protein
MGGSPLGARTPDHAAAALGVARDRVQALVDTGVLRVLPLAGGGWLTSDAAIAEAARALSGVRPARHARSSTASRRRARSTRETPPAAQVAATPPRDQAPPPAAPPPPPVDTTPRVALDTRPDVQPNGRLDMRAAAQLLHLDERTTLALARDGKLRATQLGREWVTTARDVRSYIAAVRRTQRSPS